jgi:hypothetical protein
LLGSVKGTEVCWDLYREETFVMICKRNKSLLGSVKGIEVCWDLQTEQVCYDMETEQKFIRICKEDRSLLGSVKRTKVCWDTQTFQERRATKLQTVNMFRVILSISKNTKPLHICL